MRWTNRRLGIWEGCRTRWLVVRGTTPRNADVWTLDVELGISVNRPGMWLITGRHLGVSLWVDGDRCLHVHRRPPTMGRRACRCWTCRGARTGPHQRRGGWDVTWVGVKSDE